MLALALVSVKTANAQVGGRDRGVFLGIRLVGSALHVGNAGDPFSVDHGGGGAVIFGGYSFTNVFSLELDLTDVKHKTSEETVDASLNVAQVLAHYHLSSNRALRPYFKAGLGGYTLRLEDSASDVSVHGGGVSAGVGFDYFVSQHFSLEADLSHNVILFSKKGVALADPGINLEIVDDASMTAVGLSLTYHF